MFASSGDPNVFWPGIVEKAYAKLHGSYASLQGGSVADALVDLTGSVQRAQRRPAANHVMCPGGVAVKWELKDGQADAGGGTDSDGDGGTVARSWGSKWRKLVRYHGKGHLMGCSLILRGCEGNIDNGQGVLFNHA